LAAALFYGLAPNIAKLGLIGGFSPMAGTIVSTAAVVPLYYGMVAWSQKKLFLPRVAPYYLAFAILAGFTHTLGTLFQFSALRLEYISIVQSVINLNPLVTVLVLLAIRVEKVNRHLMIGTLLVVVGSILVVTK
jgi:uncharacterized membrane protein